MMFSLNMVDYPMSFLLLSSLGLGRKGLGPGLDNIVGGFLQTGVDWFFAWWSSHKALSFPENFSLSQDYIPCVIVFTTEMCLSLLSNVKKGNPDGTFTFDLASKHFTQFSFYRMITRSPLLYVQWAGFLTFFLNIHFYNCILKRCCLITCCLFSCW